MDNRYIRAGYALDLALNTWLLNGDPRVAISSNTAQRRLDGARWACVLCRVLDVVVERDHCTKALGGQPTARPAAIRAGVALLLFTAVIVGGVVALLRWVF